MKYTQLGNSDLRVSRICMGCMGFGDASNGQHSWTTVGVSENVIEASLYALLDSMEYAIYKEKEGKSQ